MREINFGAIPSHMKGRLQWVLWRLEPGADGNPTKVPYQPSGRKASSTNQGTWGSFTDVVAAYRGGGFSGIGYVLAGEFVAWDLDNCRDPETGQLEPWAEAIVKTVDSYTEITPSGAGLRVIAAGELPDRAGNKRKNGNVEVFIRDFYITVTGWHLPGTPTAIEDRQEECLAVFDEYFPEKSTPEPAAPRNAAANGLPDWELIAKAHQARNGAKFAQLWAGDITGYPSESEADQALCNLLAFWTGRDADRMDALFRHSGLYRDKWDEPRGQTTYGGLTITKAIADTVKVYDPNRSSRNGALNWDGSMEARGESSGPEDGSNGVPQAKIVEPPGSPLPNARWFLSEFYRSGNTTTLVFYQDIFQAWDGSAYKEISETYLHKQLYEWLENDYYYDSEGKQKPFNPDNAKLQRIVEALKALTYLPKEVQAPAWLDQGGQKPAGEFIAFPNGLLHLPTRTLHPPTPTYFNTFAMSYEYDPEAPEPREWLRFLHSQWPDDPESVHTLQELMGMAVAGETRFQKIGAIIGPPRSGKGTIARVLAEVVGRHNVVAPSLGSLTTNFGLQPLIDKPLAIIPDARLSGRADQIPIVESLLSISGEDEMTIHRKHREAWTGKLPTRVFLMSNEVPRLNDASGAISSRFLFLKLPKSFLGKEDHGLQERLMAEIPGVFLWALDGWDRLSERGYFIQPESAQSVVEAMEDLASPVTAFVKERCDMGPDKQVNRQNLYEAWQQWCWSQGWKQPTTLAAFSRDLVAAFPAVCEYRPQIGDKRPRYFKGIALQTGVKTGVF